MGHFISFVHVDRIDLFELECKDFDMVGLENYLQFREIEIVL